jgi:hypothetical protein
LFLASLPFFYAGRRGVSLRLLLIVTLVSVAVNGVWVGIVKTHRWSPLWTLVTGFGGGFVIGWPVQVLDGMEATLAWFAWVCSYMGLSGFIGLGIERLWRLRSFPGASQTAQQPFGGMQDREGVGPVCLLRPDVGVVVGEFELLCGRGRGLLSVFLDGGVRCDVGCADPESFVVFFTSHRLRGRALLEDVWQGTSATASVVSGDDEVVPVNFWGVDGRSPLPDAVYPRVLFVDAGMAREVLVCGVERGERAPGLMWRQEGVDSRVLTVPGSVQAPKSWSRGLKKESRRAR